MLYPVHFTDWGSQLNVPHFLGVVLPPSCSVGAWCTLAVIILLLSVRVLGLLRSSCEAWVAGTLRWVVLRTGRSFLEFRLHSDPASSLQIVGRYIVIGEG